MIRYYEFDEHCYYALIAVTVEDGDFATRCYRKATELYVDVVAGESVEEVLKEAYPHLRTREYAFMKFISAHEEEDRSVKELLTQFDEAENEVLLVDSSLL
ncbi:hypothetical protein NST33_17655 [Paenibacillus sp. FSL L8-0435]|uniref:hypothetical protein n=1 Tax=Paenibacillus sp. FSL L8-0435 TaxID=2954618 RepID=UPI0030D9C952